MSYCIYYIHTLFTKTSTDRCKQNESVLEARSIVQAIIQVFPYLSLKPYCTTKNSGVCSYPNVEPFGT